MLGLEPGACVKDGSGKTSGLVFTLIESAGRIRAEESLHECEANFRALFANGPIGAACHQTIYDESGKPIDYRFIDEKVFLIFQWLHVTEKYPGTGIGLAACKKIVEGHGGKIWIESSEGEGASFCFTVPAGGIRPMPFNEKGPLRRQAEEKLKRLPPFPEALSPEETRQALHELRVYQIELEMQNEELRKAQLQLEALRARYFDLYNLAPVGYCTIDAKGLIREVNLAAENLMGVAGGGLIAQPFTRFILKEDQDIYYLYQKQLKSKGEPLPCELRLTRLNGAVFWGHLVGGLAQDSDGAPVCRVVLSDVTERKRTESALKEQAEQLCVRNERVEQVRQALQESEARYRNLIEYAPVAIFVDRDGRVVLANDACARLFGAASPGQLIGKTPFELVHPDFHDILRERIRLLLDSGKPGPPIEEKIVRMDGSSVDVESSAAPFQDQGGSAVHVVLFDITERKRAETFREMGLEILQILNEPGELKDSIQRILTVLKTRTGFDAAGIRMKEGEDFPYFAQDGFPHDFLLTENTLLERGADGEICRDKEGNVSLECTCGLVISGKADPANPLFTPGGSWWTKDSFPLLELPLDQDPRHHPRNQCVRKGYASVALVPIRAHDRIVGLIQLNDRRKGCFTRGMVEVLEGIAAHIGSALMRKRAEADKAKLESHLQQSQKMESVGRLAGGVAHDFNNILQAIIGNVEMALEDIPPGSPGRESLEEIRKCADRSAHLTRQLLAFARRQTISPKVLDLNEIVAGMLKMIRRLIGANIEISWQPQPDLWSVKADPSQIDQVLANLCVNARDAISGGGKLTIETGNRTIAEAYGAAHAGVVPGDYVRLAVSDNGSGMDVETLDHIFEPFFTSKGVGKGTGLGLPTVYGIVKQNEGFINVSSKPGRGSSFEIFLPRTRSEATSALAR